MIKGIAELHEIQSMLRTLTKHPFVLAGGCVRDVLHNRKPKDYDAVLCLGYDDYSCAFDTVQDISRRLSGWGIKSECYMAYGTTADNDIKPGAFEEVFLCCMKCTLPDGEDVDLLFSRKQNIADHCAMHDCNLNMVWLDDEQLFGYGGPTLPAQSLVFRPGIAKERIKYMTDKMKDYGY